ncbi:5-methylcytosine restriction system specificity protein McrC [Aureispira sp. CCB-E]|uniref:McrC family protein n=1 Tax=Aureispira sp. CCB-E TaxID=3051121 RepID=UPI00286886C5|nr:restriction endonuclease [Aureispira sp. CCB-E]WMX17126.1 restriction endonuclease [Aureispira sp. CCB-E]
MNDTFQIFEHQALYTNRGNNELRLTQQQLGLLEQFYGDGNDFPYYSLVNKGIKFRQYVGVLKIGNTTIEVLPKAGKIDNKETWQNRLIEMLKAVGMFNIHAPSSSNLNIKQNSILDLYFELFITEIEYLLHRGLIKKYNKKEGNQLALKGKIKFNKHIQQNLIHQERFYIAYTNYDINHKLHAILYKTLLVLRRINLNPSLISKIGKILLDFPPMPNIKVTPVLFEKIVYNRKNTSYKTAIDIAQLILLNYHPNITQGNNHVLALMFDMNLLWEQFVAVSLQKNNSFKISTQSSKNFWKPSKGYASRLRPDIIIELDKKKYVLDTKWKNLYNTNPSSNDLRQMFAYLHYFDAKKAALVYPSYASNTHTGHYYDTKGNINQNCSVLAITTEQKIRSWQKAICLQIEHWITEPN